MIEDIQRSSSSSPSIWSPANGVEAALVEAWRREDVLEYLTLVARAPLYLSGGPEGGSGGGQAVLTERRPDRTYLVVGTSPAALSSAAGAPVTHCLETSFAELHPLLPGAEWGLAVSPNVPAGAYLAPDHLRTMAQVAREDAGFDPAGPVEELMWQAVRTATRSTYLDALVLAELVVTITAPANQNELRRADFPWLITTIEEQPSIVVFTSTRRMSEAGCASLASVCAPALAVARAWPDQRYRMLINPGAPIQGSLSGQTVPLLIDVAGDVAARVRKSNRREDR